VHWIPGSLVKGERGSATVVALGWMLALIVLAGILFELSQTVITTTRLQWATDRAALAAADVLIGVTGHEPCTIARDLLEGEGFSVRSCVPETHSVRVVGEVLHRGVWHTQRAHAGVVESGHQ
jgi:secretion/DNA translocation related TadE-like protein